MSDGFPGRDVLFRWGGDSPADEIPGIREKGLEISGEAINVTSDENSGWRKLLETPSVREVNISISGVTKDTRFISDWFNDRRIQPAALEYPSGFGTISGDFRIASLSITGTYDDATTLEATLESTGTITFTP